MTTTITASRKAQENHEKSKKHKEIVELVRKHIQVIVDDQ